MTVLGKRYWKKNEHPCTIETCDMAVGTSDGITVPVTAFKYRCVLCGREYIDITESGIEQIQKLGYDAAIQWSSERKKKGAKK